jgi:ABC-type multidrug transport system fused ATPase/permease subunit
MKIFDSRFNPSLILSKTDQKKFLLVVFVQTFLAVFDLVAVGLIGLLAALSLLGIQSKPVDGRVEEILTLLNLSTQPFQIQVATLALIVATIFVFRTFFSIFLNRRILYFLSFRASKLTTELIKKMYSQNFINVSDSNQYERTYTVTYGVTNIALGILGSFVFLVSDIALLIVLFIGLMFVSEILAISTIVFFMSVGAVLYLTTHTKAHRLGTNEYLLNVKSNELISLINSSYRELVLRNKRMYFSEKIGDHRRALSTTQAEIAMLPNTGKYVIECSLVLGSLFISAIQFLMQDAYQAIATLSIFLAAGARIAPAILRIQQNGIQIRKSLGTAHSTIELINSLSGINVFDEPENVPTVDHEGFEPKVVLTNVSFTYPDAENNAVENLSLTVKTGNVTAIVGPSGAGKSTLADLLLGLVKADEGSIEISNLEVSEVPKTWPGAMSYVPQDVYIFPGTLLDNVLLGLNRETVPKDTFWDIMRIVHLDEFVRSLPLQELTNLGEFGATLSGGQRQRIGLARALITFPKLLVLDEATSALDGETEANISEAIRNLKGEVTVILIAHRLSTVREADQVVYLEQGAILSSGTFEEVRSQVPNFDRQASLMGL